MNGHTLHVQPDPMTPLEGLRTAEAVLDIYDDLNDLHSGKLLIARVRNLITNARYKLAHQNDPMPALRKLYDKYNPHPLEDRSLFEPKRNWGKRKVADVEVESEETAIQAGMDKIATSSDDEQEDRTFIVPDEDEDDDEASKECSNEDKEVIAKAEIVESPRKRRKPARFRRGLPADERVDVLLEEGVEFVRTAFDTLFEKGSLTELAFENGMTDRTLRKWMNGGKVNAANLQKCCEIGAGYLIRKFDSVEAVCHALDGR